jgi:putative colanic acid biosysnthesis UDP-glucose lipid carrier transferase
MTQPLIFKQSASIGLVTLLQAIVPPLLAVGSLYVTTLVYGVHFGQPFANLAVLVFALSVALYPRTQYEPTQLLIQRWPLAAGVTVRWLLLLAMLLIIGYISKVSSVYSRRVLVTWAIVTPALLIAGSLAIREFMRRMLMTPANARKVVFAGCNHVSVTLAQRLKNNSELCMTVAGFFDDRNAERLDVTSNVNLLGKLPELASHVKDKGIDVIFIALPIRHISRVMDLLDELRDTTASIYYVPDILVFDLIQARTGEIMGIPVVSMCETPFHGVRGFTKRLTDVAVSMSLLLFGAPLLFGIAAIVRLTSAGPVIFRQRRYGLDGREIMVYKFRTMTVTEDGGQIVQATKQDSRITPIGRFLRRYSLDELPQLVNVLQGRMSLVGPRPHAVAHNEEYRKLIKGYMLRHKVLPGITGLAQINGCRGETIKLEDMQARVNYDLDYLRHWSPLLDLKILVLTVGKVLRDERAY